MEASAMGKVEEVVDKVKNATLDENAPKPAPGEKKSKKGKKDGEEPSRPLEVCSPLPVASNRTNMII
jgi:hypothetical protein